MMTDLLFGQPFGLLDCVGVLAIAATVAIAIALKLQHRRSRRRRGAAS